MRAHLTVAPPLDSDRAAALLAELRSLAPSLEEAECLEAIGETAKLAAVLATRHAWLVSARAGQQTPPEGLLDAKGAAARLCLPVRTVYRLAREGKLVAVHAGSGTVRFDPADLDRFVRARKGG